MKDLALSALDAVTGPGVSYADVRAIEIRDRQIATKNGKVGHASENESMGIGIRVVASGCWGFAATDDLTPAGIASCAAQAREIARASSVTRKQDVALAPEEKHVVTWISPCRIDPFSISAD